jgi:hypothetical protein
MQDTLIGVDIAKNVFQLAVSHRPGRFDGHARLSRDQFLPHFAQLPRSDRSDTAWSCCRPMPCGPTCGGTRPTTPRGCCASRGSSSGWEPSMSCLPCGRCSKMPTPICARRCASSLRRLAVRSVRSSGAVPDGGIPARGHRPRAAGR